jgi:hypothetical protein
MKYTSTLTNTNKTPNIRTTPICFDKKLKTGRAIANSKMIDPKKIIDILIDFPPGNTLDIKSVKPFI